MKYRFFKRSADIPKLAAWFLVVAGILLGTVFSFGMHYWESSVSKEDAIFVEATFSSCERIYRRGHLKEIKISFQNSEPLFIDGACCSQSVQDKLGMLKPGAILQLYVHPHSSTLLEIKSDNNSILLFEESIKKLSSEVSVFLLLGIFMYACAVYGIIKLLLKQTY